MQQDLQQFVDWINTHYITYRQRYLLQRLDGSGYSTISKPLHDGLIKAHLQQKLTIGVFAGKFITKFMCFDIDAKEGAQSLTRDLIDVLVSKYGLSEKNVLLSASGSKGYHIELFFDEPVTLTTIKQFYELVLTDLGATTQQIELRPTNQGVKLPLSLHRKTGIVCHLLDHNTFTPLPARALFDIEQIERALFVEQLEEYWTHKPVLVSKEQAEKFEAVIDGMQVEIPIDYQERIQYAIDQKKLLYPNTRHTMTLLLAIYFKDVGLAYPDTMRCIRDILHHSFNVQKGFYSRGTDKCFIDIEINRITTLVYERDYHIKRNNDKPIRFYKEDVLFTLKAKRLPLQKLLFAMICHAKRFATKDGTFYMSYAQMTAYGNASNRRILQTAVNTLEKMELIEIVSRNECKKNSHIKRPNYYRLNMASPKDSGCYFELEKTNINDYTHIVSTLVTSEELKRLVTKNQFYKVYKSHYTAS